jgi:hypothetical protein
VVSVVLVVVLIAEYYVKQSFAYRVLSSRFAGVLCFWGRAVCEIILFRPKLMYVAWLIR